MDLRPTNKTAEEIAIEYGWTCRSQYGEDRITHHSELHVYDQRMMVFGNEQFFVETYECKHCGLKMDVVRPPKGPRNPEADHAERCARPGCGHLKHEHNLTVEGPDNNRVWVRLWCRHGYSHGPEDGCPCKRYVAPKTGPGVSLLPSAEVEDVNRRA